MTTIARLDDNDRLIGYKKLGKKVKTPDGAIVVDDGCDLPTDGTYKWDQKHNCFMPLGHGFGKPNRAPIPDIQALYLVALTVDNPPQELRDWMKWYEDNLKQAHEELGIRARR